MNVLSRIVVVVLALSFVNSGKAELMTGLTNIGLLVRFNSTNPLSILGAPVSVTGLTAGDSLVAIDYRPIDGVLVGLGYNSGAGTGRVYSINTTTGAGTQILGINLPVGFGVTQFGFDFNPVANALRIIDTNDNNTRITVGGTGSVFADTSINPAANSIVASAYSNNNAGAATTTLFNIDATSSSLVIQNPPNNGTIVPVGVLGIAGATVTGMDISGATGVSYLSAFGGPSSQLYTVNLTTGAAALVGNIGGGINIIDISVISVPEPTCFSLIAAAGVAIVIRRRSRR